MMDFVLNIITWFFILSGLLAFMLGIGLCLWFVIEEMNQ